MTECDDYHDPWGETDTEIELSELFCVLNDFERRIMFLVYIGHSVREIARMCNLPKSTLYDRITAARRKMQKVSDTL